MDSFLGHVHTIYAQHLPYLLDLPPCKGHCFNAMVEIQHGSQMHNRNGQNRLSLSNLKIATVLERDAQKMTLKDRICLGFLILMGQFSGMFYNTL